MRLFSYKEVIPYAERFMNFIKPACEKAIFGGNYGRLEPIIYGIGILALSKKNIDGEDMLAELLAEKFSEFKDKIAREMILEYNADRDAPIDIRYISDPGLWASFALHWIGTEKFSHRFFTNQKDNGLMPDDLRQINGKIYRGAEELEIKEEPELFDLWGMNYIPPERRFC